MQIVQITWTNASVTMRTEIGWLWLLARPISFFPHLDIVYDGCDYDDGCQERDPDELNGLEKRKKRQS